MIWVRYLSHETVLVGFWFGLSRITLPHASVGDNIMILFIKDVVPAFPSFPRENDRGLISRMSKKGG